MWKKTVNTHVLWNRKLRVYFTLHAVPNVKSHQMLSEHSHLGSIVGTALPFSGGFVKQGSSSHTLGGSASRSILDTSVAWQGSDNQRCPPIHGVLPSEIDSEPAVDGGQWQRGEGARGLRGFFELFQFFFHLKNVCSGHLPAFSRL